MLIASKPSTSITIGAGTAHLGAINGVCVMAFRGTLTLPLYLEASYRAVSLIDTRDCTAIYVGVDKALVAMSEAELREGTQMFGPAACARLRLPGALCVSEIVLKLAQRHAYSAAMAGFERRAFTSQEPAWKWAVSRASQVRTQRLEDRCRGFAPSMPAAL